jgi:hypothetical protein
MVIQPFAVAQNAFLYKAQSFGDSAAFEIARRAVDDDTIAVLVIKRKLDHASRGPCDDAETLPVLIDPVAQFRDLIGVIDAVLSNDTCKDTTIEDAEGVSVVLGCSLRCGVDELQVVHNGRGIVDPRQPLAKIPPVFIDKPRQGDSVVLGELAEFDIGVNSKRKRPSGQMEFLL